jgi:hypothetical protein
MWQKRTRRHSSRVAHIPLEIEVDGSYRKRYRANLFLPNAEYFMMKFMLNKMAANRFIQSVCKQVDRFEI